MSRIQFRNFLGIAPKVPPYSLKEGMGQKAQAADLTMPVMLRPLPGLKHAYDLDTGDGTQRVKSVYLFENDPTFFWFQSFEDVDFVRGPLPEDDKERTYYTDPQFPKVTRDDVALGSDPLPVNWYRLGVPQPVGAPGIVSVGPGDADTLAFTTAYVQTFVTSWGEEGPPSEASELLEMYPGSEVALTLIEPPTLADVDVSSVYLYRLNTSSSGTEFQFVDEITLPLPAEYLDSKYNSELAELIPSEDWYPPPDETHPTGTMQGIIGLPNGSLAGFTSETLCVSVPYIPHAWPFASRYTIKDRIVGLSPVARGIAILTDFAPYVASGNSPEAMSLQRLASNQACVSKRSIVDMGGYALYASPEGLVMTDGSRVELVTDALFEERQWKAYAPASIEAYHWNGQYVGFYDTGAKKGGFVFSMEGGQPAFSDLGIHAHAGHYESRLDTLYLAIEDKLYEFAQLGSADYTPLDVNEATATELETTMVGIGATTAQAIVDERTANGEFLGINDMTRVSGVGQATVDDNAHRITVDVAPGRSALWRSAITNTPTAETMSDLRIVGQGKGRLTVYADGRAVSTHFYDSADTVYQFFRLPSGFRAREWEVEARVDGELYQIDLASSRQEIEDR